MTLLTAERGQALQVGAVLLFGILVILFTVWQAFVIPDQNERVEFSHNQEVQSEMVELRGDIVSTADATTPASPSVRLGEQFPTRLLFINPTPAAGTLRTVSLGDEAIGIRNVTAIGNGTGEQQYWNVTERVYETTSLQYAPDYRVFQGAPNTLYDNTVTYNNFAREANTSALSEQAVIDGNTITILPLVGEYAESGIGTVTPDIEPVSTRSRSVAIRDNASAGNITLSLPTRLNVSQWEALLGEEENVRNVRQNPSGDEETVVIELEPGQYELRMARIGIGEGLAETRPAYITAVDGTEDRVAADRSRSITVEVRDRFNVPQNQVNITASVNDSKGKILPATETTNVDGQATFKFDPDADNLSANETVPITFNETLSGTFVDGDGQNLTVNVTTEGAIGEFIELRWTDVATPNQCNSDNGTDRREYYEQCDYDSPTSIEGTYEITAFGGNASGLDVQVMHTNETLGSVENGTDKTSRFSFVENNGNYTAEVTLSTSSLSGGSTVETTLVAFVGGKTETLFLGANQ
jgi:hypothetical protein